MSDNSPIFTVNGINLLNVPQAKSLAAECIEHDCYRLRELAGVWNVIDIGACYGEFALYSASLGHHVKAVEPAKKSFSILKANQALNDHAPFFAINSVCVGDPTETQLFRYRPDHPAGSHLDGVYDDPNIAESYWVDTTTIPRLLNQLTGKVFLKFDCEGAERGIFSTADAWIDSVHAISMETHNADSDIYGDYLKKRGFHVELYGTSMTDIQPWDKSMLGGLLIARR